MDEWYRTSKEYIVAKINISINAKIFIQIAVSNGNVLNALPDSTIFAKQFEIKPVKIIAHGNDFREKLTFNCNIFFTFKYLINIF